eukprot:1385709-Amorphochlora_amoeboformis.AAC.1
MITRLRVTRILKCLGEMNLEHYKKPFLLHIAKEMFEGYLRACLRSLSMYWLPVLKNKQDREEVKEYIKRIASEEKKVWQSDVCTNIIYLYT